MFPDYPAGRPGIGILALRAGLGVALIAQGALCLWASGPAPEMWVGFSAALAGFLLAIGFLIPLVVVVTCVGAAAVRLLLPGICSSNLFDGHLSMVFAGVILLALLFVGPGAFSLDARLFGRREIIIPPRTSVEE